jgi:hypothetical protein
MSTDIHKVFISYHHTEPDQSYRIRFESLFANQHQIIVNKSVQIGDIEENLNTESVRQKIREEYLSDSTVTVVLIGNNTWQRKHVDWEISSSIRQTKNSSRSGLIGIFLPSFQMTEDSKFNPYKIPPRLYYNFECKFATLHKWSDNPVDVKEWIHQAFDRRNSVNPNNTYEHYANNRSGLQWQ